MMFCATLQTEQVAFLEDAFAVNDVELGLAERRCHLVLHHFDLGAISYHCIAVFNGGNTLDIEADRGIEFPGARPPVVVSGLLNMTPIFSRIWLMKMRQVRDFETTPVSLRNACDMSRAWTPM